jgi:hypothetical protein
VNFSEQPPSKQWLALGYKGEKFAEVWFKPEGEPFGLTFRIPKRSFQTPGMDERLTTENLLKAVGLAAEEVDACRHGDISQSGMDGLEPELRQPLPPPPPDVSHLDIHVRLKAPSQVLTPNESSAPIGPAPNWQDLDARWNAILGVEASIDALRLTMESVRMELEAAWSRTLTPEEKLHALRADVVQWHKAKNRIHHALPKLREFVHRATWAMGAPERKELEEFFKNVGPDMPLPEMDRVPDELESLLKSRQILSAQGVVVFQECKSISADIDGALRTLKNNAAVNAMRKRDANRAGGKFFKDVRRWSMGKG